MEKDDIRSIAYRCGSEQDLEIRRRRAKHDLIAVTVE